MLTIARILPRAQELLATITTDGLLVEAARLLANPNINLIVVCDLDGRMAGVITKTDVVARIGHCTGFSCRAATAEVMTRDVTFCGPDDRLTDVWSVMRDRGLKNIPVVDAVRKPLGVLNARDAVETLLEDARYEEQLLRDYVTCVGYR